MRLLVATIVLAAVAVQLVLTQGRPDPRLFRGPFISIREVFLVRPARQLPVEFEGAQILMANTAPWTTLSNVRLQVRLQSKTVRPVSAGGITLRVAVGSADRGMFTFRMRAVPRAAEAPEDSQRIRQNGLSELVTFAALTGQSSPGLQLLQPASKIVFTLERLDGDDGQVVFENPDATELLWEALGRPSFTLQ